MRELSIFIDKNNQYYEELKVEIIDFGHTVIESMNDQKVDVAIYFNYRFLLKAKTILSKKVDNFLLVSDQGVYINQGSKDSFKLSVGHSIDDIIDSLILISQDLDISKYDSVNLDKYFKVTLSDNEYKKLIYDWNATDKYYPKDKTVYQLFEEQVEKNPDNIALMFEGEELTYGKLNERANQLARYIRKQYKEFTNHELKPDTLIPLCLERSLDMVIGILGVMKSGGAYVPMDPNYPDERFKHILIDTNASLIITQSHLEDKLRLLAVELDRNIDFISIDLVVNAKAQEEVYVYSQDDKVNLLPQSNPTDLAYVIYTSGTTGLPKGVMLEHKGVNAVLEYLKEVYVLNKEDKVTQFTSYVFDVSISEIFISLIQGSTLHILSKETINNVNNLSDYLINNEINYCYLPPILLSQLPQEDYPKLKSFIYAGEPLSKAVANYWSNKVRLHNIYGPTEVTIYASHKTIELNEVEQIGKALSNTKLYILDSNKQPVAIGVIGELYIGGAGLARGYLNRPGLTAEKFIVNPFATEKDKLNGYTRLYKTGDLVRWFPDGNIEYIGRNDFQVKIRGYRIELKEIENQLSSIEGIKQSCVLAKDKNETKYLVGYYVSDKVSRLTQEQILSQLSNTLPNYMLPSELVEMECFPFTTNGKLDREKLLNVTVNSVYHTTFNPYDKIEKFIGDIWLKILPIKPEILNSYSNFLSLGGNSLLVTKIVSSINNKYGIFLKASDLFKHVTLGQLSQHVRDNLELNKKDFDFKPEKDKNTRPFALTDVQSAYLLGRVDGLTLGNISTHIYMELSFDEIDVRRLEFAINKLINRHQQLRTVININESTQSILFDVPVFHLDKGSTLTIREEMSHQVFNISKYPLFDFKYSLAESGKYILHCGFDAIITDVYSLSILFNDLNSFYNGSKLPELGVSFDNHIDFCSKFKNTKYYNDAKEYWAKKIPDLPKYPQLPLLNHPNNIKKINFINLNREISKDIFLNLTNKAAELNISATSVLLFCYSFILSRFSGQNDCLINLTLFNREYFHKDIDKVVGDFTTLELFRFSLDNETKLKNILLEVHNSLWEDLDYRSYSGIEVIRDIRKHRGLSPNELIAPYVFTSALGHKMFPDNFLDDKFEGINYESAQTSQCIIDNIARETKQGISIDWYYVEQLFDPEVISYMHKSYCDLIECLAEADWNDSLPKIELPKLDKSVIEQANRYIQPEVESTLVRLFTDSLKASPSFIAVVDCDGEYNYKTISEYTNAISLYLYDHGLCESGRLIGVLSEKGYQQVVSTLGIMQSGSAYLPLHVDWPRGRCDEVLSEGNVETVLLSNTEFNGCIKGSDIEVKYNWLIIEDIINYKSNTKLENLSKPSLDDIAYVIFTSGSTGKPKGVTISHRGAVNTILAVNEKFNIYSRSKIFALSELSFDLSVYDIFGLLAAGGTIVFPDQKKTKDPSHWYELIDKHNITIWNTVPQLMSLLVDYVRDSNKQLPSLKVTLMSGDWIPLNLPKQIKEVCPNITVMSLGGATEGSIWSIWYEIKNIDQGWKSIPYGQSMPNQKMYVLNEFGEHNPIGVIGEIYIGGQGVALGYWHDEQKTKASFIDHPELGRLYKTGDLGKWNRDSYIVFEGRKDGQVKLNGYRVELDEISSKLAKLPGVENALVTIQDNQLVGYLVSEKFKKKDNEIDYQAFKLEQKGILRGLKTIYKLNPIINIDRYKLRKSYRKFDHKIDISSLDIQIQKKCNQRSIPTTLTHEQLTELLSPLNGIQLEDRILPKYLYPSGGSAYAIRAFVNIPKGYIEGIDEGVYYYHPIEHALQLYRKRKVKGFSIKFNLYINAMKPLYKDETLRLAYLELGHILQLLNEKYPVAYEIQDRQEGDYHKLVKVTLGQQCMANKLNIKKVANDGNKFDSYDLNFQPIMLQISELGSILTNSSGILIFEADKNLESYIQAGYMAQEITTNLYQQNIGSTVLGFNLTDSSVYMVAIGGISQEQKQLSEVNTDRIYLEKFISKKLKNYLPKYMIPETYLTIDHLPLTTNGKVNYKKLPKAELINQDNYVSPTTELEKQLCQIWEEVLELKQVGIRDSFLKLGGNSFTSIRLINQIKSSYNVSIQVSDLFTYQSIASLVDNFSFKEISIDENEDILWI
ncbi:MULTISPECIES: non-ribosomal peptide synthetase [unclassified Francisella]|uniref:non-ribosomal peptide synthetase n=1 Tax=unclassified Francisella TaxID=2610885 RepID=UPI002E2EAE03|nr:MULTISPECIES: non-ribosomal peptide synthetase [unclassified Francisella]MED7818926.1 amino acid adenylation domain-containing protein [Francisella sp. 19S2-4]MED7829763.1 amino acid adenylation domain-containing protein [Francisella sp. 19S2-10]